MKQLLEGHTALITGASKGIGASIAERLASAGAIVGLLGRDVAALESVAEGIRTRDGTALPLVADIADGGAVEAAVNELRATAGPVTILVNNAGIARDGLLARMKDEQWQAVLQTNLYGAFAATRAVVRDMLRARHGAILNISSVVGVAGNAGQTNYAAAKAGLIGFTRSAAKELSPRGIRVNAIAPGFIHTNMTAQLSKEDVRAIEAAIPLQRLGTPADVAGAALFLVSPLASYITGQVLHVNGGYYTGIA
ncbi:MAG: 3-oxoacyl-[acyl-carrier-protein] reductase [Candidatus Schekmanbacteria bacterium]|nr:3-oxoacyl-[acyl-carrier-protein] reductase [Candidatus Schekmanbacteria bacterium]